MSKQPMCFTDLANELFLDIFDYLRPLDIICSFYLTNPRLNQLITSLHFHIDMSNLSKDDFDYYCQHIFSSYQSQLYSLKLSNNGACGSIKLFLFQFNLQTSFPNLQSLAIIEPSVDEYQNIMKMLLTMSQLKHLSIKMTALSSVHCEIFSIQSLKTCILSYDGIISFQKIQSSLSSDIEHLTLDGFYLNEINLLFHHLPHIRCLIINKLSLRTTNFILSSTNLSIMKLNCDLSVRFHSIELLLTSLTQLKEFSFTANGNEYLNSQRWQTLLTSLPLLTKFSLDIITSSATSTDFDTLSSSFQTKFWQQHHWNFVVDCSAIGKFHLYTIPPRASFIQSLNSLRSTQISNIYNNIEYLYVKLNETFIHDDEALHRQNQFPNVHSLQLYPNTTIQTIPDVILFLRQTLDFFKLVHLEIFVCLSTLTFSQLLNNLPRIRYLKTDYDLLLDMTSNFQILDINMNLNKKIKKFVLRNGCLLEDKFEQFMNVFSNIEYLIFSVSSTTDLHYMVPKLVKRMPNLISLHVKHRNDKSQLSFGTNSTSQMPVWDDLWNNMYYQIYQDNIKVWK